MELQRRGVELSVNFIVGLILAIAVLTAGLFLLGKIGNNSESILETYRTQYMKDMEKLACPSEEYVCIGTVKRDTSIGRAVGYTLRVLNAEDTAKTFTISITSKTTPPNADASKILFLPKSTETYTINSGDSQEIPIVLYPQPGTTVGTYAFLVKVTDATDSADYGAPKLIYLIVR